MNAGWMEMGAMALGGGGLTTLLNYVRQSRKDASHAQVLNAKQTSDINMAVWVEITKEQRDWRETMRSEMVKLRTEMTMLQSENVGLLRKVAELEAHNADLMRDNKDLETRVKELERELRTAGAVAVVGAMPGLVGT